MRIVSRLIIAKIIIIAIHKKHGLSIHKPDQDDVYVNIRGEELEVFP